MKRRIQLAEHLWISSSSPAEHSKQNISEFLLTCLLDRIQTDDCNRRVKSPYTLSVVQQVNLCVVRGFQRLRRDASLTLTQLIGNTIMALIIGSVFYNLRDDTSSFYSRGALLFFAVLLNAFSSALEVRDSIITPDL